MTTIRVSSIGLVIILALATTAKGKEDPSRVYVVNTGSDSVSLVDLETMKEVDRFDVGSEPYGVVVTPEGDRVAVGIEGEARIKPCVETARIYPLSASNAAPTSVRSLPFCDSIGRLPIRWCTRP
jgi:YVTN family beta-propeller protein